KGLKDSKITAEALNNAVVDALERSLLKPGDKLPSTRDIALFLGVSRTTVVKAFDMLIATGHLTSSQGAGTWVSSRANGDTKDSGKNVETFSWSGHHSELAGRLSSPGLDAGSSTDPTQAPALDEANFGSAPIDLLPTRAWRESLSRASKTIAKTGFKAKE